VSTVLSPQEVPIFFYVRARERADRGHACRLGTGPSRRFGAFATCRPRLLVTTGVRQLADGSVAVRLFVYRDEKRAVWHIQLAVTALGGRQSVAFDDLPNRDGFLRSRVEFRGVGNPRVRVSATRSDGLHCALRYDPTNFSTEADGPSGPIPLPSRSLRPTLLAAHESDGVVGLSRVLTFHP